MKFSTEPFLPFALQMHIFNADVGNKEDLQGNVVGVTDEMEVIENSKNPDIAQTDAIHEAKGNDDP